MALLLVALGCSVQLFFVSEAVVFPSSSSKGGDSGPFVTSDFLVFIPPHVRQEADAARPEVSERVRNRRILFKGPRISGRASQAMRLLRNAR